MYIYNVTINIEESVHDEWRAWIESQIALVLNTGRFVSAKFTEVLVDEEMGGKTYSVQFTAKTKKDLEAYYQFDAAKIEKSGVEKFGERMLSFRTELKIINEFFPTTSH